MHTLQPYVDDIWWAVYGILVMINLTCCTIRSVLFQHFESPEEGTRNVVAECVGKLTLLEPETLLPRLQVTTPFLESLSNISQCDLKENLKSPSAYVRGTVVTAFKYTISDQPQPIDHLLRNCITDFMETLGDPELVRTQLLLLVDCLHHMTHCILECATCCIGCTQFCCTQQASVNPRLVRHHLAQTVY